jgi:hypothetical protein
VQRWGRPAGQPNNQLCSTTGASKGSHRLKSLRERPFRFRRFPTALALEKVHVEVVAQDGTDRMTKPRRGKALRIRRDRIFTLLGSLVIFATFVVKEGIGENLKDLVSSIETAENLFILREDTAFRVNLGKPLPTPSPDTGPTRDEMKDYIAIWDGQSEGLVPVSLDLAESLPDKVKFKVRADQINGELWEIGNGIVNVRGSSLEPQTEAQMYAATKAFYGRSLKNFAAANLLRVDVLDQAKQLKEKRETRYKIAKWVSYVLFSFGWGLTFYGQLARKGTASLEDKKPE